MRPKDRFDRVLHDGLNWCAVSSQTYEPNDSRYSAFGNCYVMSCPKEFWRKWMTYKLINIIQCALQLSESTEINLTTRSTPQPCLGFYAKYIEDCIPLWRSRFSVSNVNIILHDLLWDINMATANFLEVAKIVALNLDSSANDRHRISTMAAVIFSSAKAR